MGIAGGYVHPLLQGIMVARPNLQNKNSGGWKASEKKWQQHVNFIPACNRGMAPPDSIMLEDLRLCLDAADQALLERRLDQNSNLSLTEFFE